MKKLISLCLMLAFFLSASAQTDIGLWSGISIEKELSKKWKLGFEEEIRFDNNITLLNRLLTEVAIQYKVNKYYRTSLVYRFTYYTEGGLGNRLVWSNTARYKVEDFTFSYRLNFQTDFNTEEPIRYKIRNRLGANYKFNKHWEIGVTGELFYSFYYNRNVLDRYRVAFGVDHNFNKRHRLSPGIMFQSQINTADPNSDFVFRIGYKYTWK